MAPFMFHPNEETRAARLAWNALLTLRNGNEIDWPTRGMIERVMYEMNRNGLFDKPGIVLQGPIPGDFEGTPFDYSMLDG